MKYIKKYEEKDINDILKKMEGDKEYEKYKYKYMVVHIYNDFASGGKDFLMLCKFISIFMGEIFFEYYEEYNGEINKYSYQAKVGNTEIIEVFDDFKSAKKFYELAIQTNKYNL